MRFFWHRSLFVCLIVSCLFFGIWQWQMAKLEKRPASYGFDAQNLALWKTTAREQMLPFRDVFYPYGLIFYYANALPFATALVDVLSVGSLALVLWVIWEAGNSVMFRVSGIISFLVLTVHSLGIDTWSRYGISLAAAVTIPRIVVQCQLRVFLFLGIFIGLLFAGVQDQAVYILMILCVCILINAFFNERSGFRHRLLQSIYALLLTILGCVIGFLPFLYYLISTQSLNGFLKHFVYLSDIAKIAKTPFIPYALSASNCFVFATYFMGAMLISYIILVKRKNISEATLRISCLCFLIAVLEQKSIIRSIDWQIVMVAFVLLILCLSWIFKSLKSFKWLAGIVLATIILGLPLIYPFRNVMDPGLQTHESGEPYFSVINYLSLQPDFNGKLFSYPGAPLFYQITLQKPPFFFTSYESTPEWTQQIIIQYLKSESINYLVYDTRVSAIQDGVPSYARNALELSYLLTHYESTKLIGPFLVLHRDPNTNPSHVCSIVSASDLCPWQQNVSLGMLPATQGKSVTYTNLSIVAYPFDSLHKVLLIKSKSTATELTWISINLNHDHPIQIKFNSCSTCVVDLDRIPGLYQSKAIQSIQTSAPAELLVGNSDQYSANLW